MSSRTRLFDGDLLAKTSSWTRDWFLGSRTYELGRRMGCIKQRDGLGRTTAFFTFTT